MVWPITAGLRAAREPILEILEAWGGNGRLKVEIPVQLGFLETATLEGLVE